MAASHKLAEEMYKAAQAQQAGTGAQPGGQAEESAAGADEKKSDDGGAVDAEFEVVDDENKNN
jgi:hypothetical protein